MVRAGYLTCRGVVDHVLELSVRLRVKSIVELLLQVSRCMTLYSLKLDKTLVLASISNVFLSLSLLWFEER